MAAQSNLHVPQAPPVHRQHDHHRRQVHGQLDQVEGEGPDGEHPQGAERSAAPHDLGGGGLDADDAQDHEARHEADQLQVT